MRALTNVGASHFVGSFSAEMTSASYGVEDYIQYLSISPGKTFVEGRADFSGMRDCILRESDRSLALSVNCFARALDGLRACSSYWTGVGLYYSAFFAAKAIMGMYGCWFKTPKSWIEVVDTTPGKQRLIFRPRVYAGSGGPHQLGWRAYYAATTSLRPSASTPEAIFALNPINSSETWLIDTRNEINYNPFQAFRLKEEFEGSFDNADIPACFSGKFSTMYTVSNAFIAYARQTAIDLSLKTDVFAVHADRAQWIRMLVTSAQEPALVGFANSTYSRLAF